MGWFSVAVAHLVDDFSFKSRVKGIDKVEGNII
jgi:hypothetical protein